MDKPTDRRKNGPTDRLLNMDANMMLKECSTAIFLTAVVIVYISVSFYVCVCGMDVYIGLTPLLTRLRRCCNLGFDVLKKMK